MFNPEKLLGGLLKNSMRGGGNKAKVGMGMGLLGVAMEAFEHFTDPSRSPKAPPPGAGPSTLPPGAGPPPAPPGAGPSSLPPGAPPAFQPPSPPPPVSAPAPAAPAAPAPAAETGPATSVSDQEAVLLIRAMISAANADGVIDADERGRILDALNRSDLSREEQTFIEQELHSPADLESIVRGVESPETARRVYTVSRMAITVDTEAEKNYMDELARRLELDRSTLDDIQ